MLVSGCFNKTKIRRTKDVPIKYYFTYIIIRLNYAIRPYK